MPPFPGFIGASYQAPSVNASCQRALNLYPEILESGPEKSVGLLRSCPGLSAAIDTLPTTPIRGLWSGGAPLTTGGRLFAVAGSKLYECFAGGTHSLLGDVGDDASHSPVYMYPNGNQLAIVSAGNLYIADGASVSQPMYTGAQGVCSTSGTAVTWVEGSLFDPAFIGTAITINAVVYTVGSVTDSKHLVLTATAGTQSNVPFLSYASIGTADMALTKVTWKSGPLFDSTLVGKTILISGVPFTVASVEDQTHLTVSGSLVYFTDQPMSSPGVVIAAHTGAYLDGYFIADKPDSKQFNISDLFNGKSWDPLDFGIKEAYPDNIGRLLADHEELWIFGESSTEVWRNTGGSAANPFPFERDLGAFIQYGIAAPHSAVNLLEGTAWLAVDSGTDGPRGGPVAVYAQGFRPFRCSTHAIEKIWRGYSTVADCVGYVVKFEGHTWWYLQFPTADATWIYDATASQQFGKPLWHERNSWDGAAFHRFRGAYHVFVWGKHIVGDFATGALYEMGDAYSTDAGQPITCNRTFPHLCNEQLNIFVSRLQLDLEVGAADLTVTLDWSYDSGRTWSTARTLTAANTNYLYRALWRRLGKARDRIIRVTITGNTQKALMNAYLDFIPGVA